MASPSVQPPDPITNTPTESLLSESAIIVLRTVHSMAVTKAGSILARIGPRQPLDRNPIGGLDRDAMDTSTVLLDNLKAHL